MSDGLFPRNFRKTYPQAVRGEGCYIFTADGRRFLDAAGGAAVVTIGHGVASVARAMAVQAERLAYVHSSQFETSVAAELSRRLLDLAPANFRRGLRLSHFGRVGSHRDGDQAGTTIFS